MKRKRLTPLEFLKEMTKGGEVSVAMRYSSACTFEELWSKNGNT